MRFNLIDEQWIPVRRRDGTRSMIAPWEVTKDFSENPVVSLDAPRPDFNGALIQFLIGLVQTVAAPQNNAEWKKKLGEPPGPAELKEKFASARHAFELGGDGPRFMQAFEPFDDFTLSGIAGLLIDAPGENALTQNKDHFVKRGTVNSMCLPCCATALFTSQINAYGDGPGYRTSLRGGSGPLTTLVISDERHNTLWQLMWMNILEKASFLSLCANPGKNAPEDTFPWLAATRTSEKFTGVETTPMDVHPNQMFWSMSQRIKLNIEEVPFCNCDICGSVSATGVVTFKKKNGGVNYVGPWLHPLTPYGRKEDGTTMPSHGERGGLTYRHWLGYINADSANNKSPAMVVHKFYDRINPDWQFRLWIFGYDIYNSAKVRCWYEAQMPLLNIDKKLLKDFENEIANLIMSASEVASNTKAAVKRALFAKVKEIKKNGQAIWEIPSLIKEDKELFYQLALAFWQYTEPAFYQTVIGIKTHLESGEDRFSIKLEWHRNIIAAGENLYSTYVMANSIEDADPKRVVIARKELEQYNRGKKIKELLGIPVDQNKADKGTNKKRAKKVEKQN
jgi:CRISPR system Cascade subunit CasA